MSLISDPEENFDAAATKFDLSRLKAAMEADKQSKISDAPWQYFQGLLCGYSTTDVSRICQVQPKTVSVALNRGIKDHLLRVLRRAEDEKFNDWKDAVCWLVGTEFDLKQTRVIDWRQVCWEMWQKQKEDRRVRQKVTEKGFEVNVHIGLGLAQREQQQRRQGNQLDRTQIYDLTEREAIVRRYEHDEFLVEVIEQPPKGNKHVAIVGEPGAGKTTLLAAIADRLSTKTSTKLPLCVSLAGLQKKPLQDYLLQVWLPEAFKLVYPDIALDETHRIAFQDWLRQGEAWLLLDGVDEMGEEYPATALNTIKTQLIDWLGNVRVALTCRSNVWDAQLNNPLSGTFDVYKTQEFKPPQIKEFLQQWFSQSQKPERGQALQQKLNEPQRERIRELVRNPLRLSLLCEVFYINPNAELPQTKAGLYEIFVRYFYEWKLEQHPTKEPQREKLNQALGKLAISGLDNENGLHRFRLPEKAARKVMGNKQFDLAEKLGWLNIVDQDADRPQAVYAFFHPTFQEYFAALAIDDWQYFLNHTPHNPSEGAYRVFDSRWKETILLWFGIEQDNAIKQKESLIDELFDFRDNLDSLVIYNYRALMFAGSAISEYASSLDELIIEALISIGLNNDTVLEPIGESAREALSETNKEIAIDFLTQKIRFDYDDGRLLDSDYWYNWILEDNSGNPVIKEDLDDLSEEEISVRYTWDFRWLKSVETLAKVGTGSRRAIRVLRDLVFEVKEMYGIYPQELMEYLYIATEGNSSFFIDLYKEINPQLSAEPDLLRRVIEFSMIVWEVNLDIKPKEANSSLESDLDSGEDICFLLEKYCSREISTYFEKFKVLKSHLHGSMLTYTVKKLKSSLSARKSLLHEDGTSEELLWHCAQNMSYPEFYAAWHSPPSATDSAAIADRLS